LTLPATFLAPAQCQFNSVVIFGHLNPSFLLTYMLSVPTSRVWTVECGIGKGILCRLCHDHESDEPAYNTGLRVF